MALDDRIACAAPACYVTTFERLIQTIGPQDAEQNIFGQLAFGMEQTDYLLMRAPKPTLVCATTEDFFDITGTWDTARQAKRFYGWLDAPECVDVVEANGKHGIGPLGRRTMVQWMRRWLAGIDQPVAEREMKYWKEAELQCTPRGQVLLEPGERSVYDLNAERAAALAEQRRTLWKDGPPAGLRDEIRNRIGARPLADLPHRTARSLGSLPRDGYRIDRLVLEAEGQLPLACLRFVPDKPTGDAALVIDGDGKAAQAASKPDAPSVAEQLVRQGASRAGHRPERLGRNIRRQAFEYLVCGVERGLPGLPHGPLAGRFSRTRSARSGSVGHRRTTAAGGQTRVSGAGPRGGRILARGGARAGFVRQVPV